MRELFAKEEAQAQERKTRQEQQQILLLQAVQDNMHTRQGRALLRWLLAQCEVFSADFGEPHFVLFQQGKRHTGMALMRLMQQQDPENMGKLLHKETQHD